MIYDDALKELKDIDIDLHYMAEDCVANYNVGLIEKAFNQAKKEHELLERLFKICDEYKYISVGLSYSSEFLNVINEISEETFGAKWIKEMQDFEDI